MINNNKHYARVENGIVIKFFSDAFETPSQEDICIEEAGDRHCQKTAVDYRGIFLYKEDKGKIIERTENEKREKYVELARIKIKLRAEQMILSRLPLWKQINLQTEASELIVDYFEKGQLTPEQIERQAYINGEKAWRDSIREQSNKMEIELDSLSVEEIKNYEPDFIIN